MIKIIRSDINIDFIGRQKIGFIFSIILILISIVSLIIHKGPNYGIDFVGGTLIQIKFSDQVSIKKIRAGLSNIGLKKCISAGFWRKSGS